MNSQTAKDEERRGRPVAPRPDPVRIEALRAGMTARGQTVKALAREIGEDASNVYKVLSGNRAASSGVGHRIAVKLGLKDVPAPPQPRAPLPANLEPTR
jgi:gp16 family phage-associated protein